MLLRDLECVPNSVRPTDFFIAAADEASIHLPDPFIDPATQVSVRDFGMTGRTASRHQYANQ